MQVSGCGFRTRRGGWPGVGGLAIVTWSLSGWSGHLRDPGVTGGRSHKNHVKKGLI